MAGVVVDEEVGAENGLVPAEDEVGGRDEGEVFEEPLVFGGEAGRDFHGGGGDEDVVAGLEPGEDALGVGHDGEDAEEVVGRACSALNPGYVPVAHCPRAIGRGGGRR